MEKSVDLFVPGRLCLFGEHSDWAGTYKTINSSIVPGCAIVVGTQQGIYAKARKTDYFSVYSKLDVLCDSSFVCKMDLEELCKTANQGGYFSYVAGVASCICESYNVGGIEIEITKMDLPMKKGLSSSAAICVLVAQAFNQIYKLHLNTMEIMNIAYSGEQRTPSRCGRMDQACAFGNNPVSIEFNGNRIKVNQIIVKKPLYYVFADLMAQKNTIRILADLNSGYPFARNEKEKKLHEALGQNNRTITDKAKELISSGSLEELGRLMTYSQALFDQKIAPMSPEELRAPILHSLLADPEINKYSYGGKGVGSQGDGAVQFLAKNKDCQQRLINYLDESFGLTAFPLTIRPHRKIKKAVIPVAGFGTRLYPETRFIKKEFCPIIDTDGLVKPVLLKLFEELETIDIEEIYLVISPNDEEMYRRLFCEPLSEEHYIKLPEEMKKYEDRISRIAKKVRLIVQKEAKGFGHAVYQVLNNVIDEPIVLMLGDTIYKSNTDISCLKQLVVAYEKYDNPIVSLQMIPIEKVSTYGVFTGEWDVFDDQIMLCTEMAEKPTLEYAREHLLAKKKNGQQNVCCAAFGAYILTPDFLLSIRKTVEEKSIDETGEIDLTNAFLDSIENQRLLGFLVDGESFDLGNAVAYMDTLFRYNRAN